MREAPPAVTILQPPGPLSDQSAVNSFSVENKGANDQVRAKIVLPSDGTQESPPLAMANGISSANVPIQYANPTDVSGSLNQIGGGGVGGERDRRMYRSLTSSQSATPAPASPAPVAAPTKPAENPASAPALADVPSAGGRFSFSKQEAAPGQSDGSANRFTFGAIPPSQAEKKLPAPAFIGSPADDFKSGTANAGALAWNVTRPPNGQLGAANFYSENDTGKLVVITDAETLKRAREVVTNRMSDTLNKDLGVPPPATPVPAPQPEILTRENAFSTFSLNVSDVSFRLAAASLQNGLMPAQPSIRSEEFINAFDYRDPEPAPGAPIAFACERAADPFAHHRDFLRFSIKTAAQGRQAGRPLNLVLLLDKSGSMERADRVAIVQKALRVLAAQLHPGDTLSVVVFARTAHLWKDGVPGDKAAEVVEGLNSLTPEGGTNLEEAMRLAYATARRHYLAGGDNRVVLLTDGAANLGNTDPAVLKQKVEENRQQGIALDCFGVGWEGYNDTLLETLTRSGNGRYGFINTPEEADTEFAGQLAGALRVAAADVKVQVEFNPKRVTSYRQIGYAKHQLTKEQFRDNSVAAAQIGAAESGNAVYTVEVNASGDGPLGTVRVRFRVPGTGDYQEHEWTVPYDGTAVALDQASPAMRLASVAAVFSEWLAGSPYAAEAKPGVLLGYLRDVFAVYGADPRPAKLQTMILEAERQGK
jgi:Mg-chelatase subunit ChlD